jgi:hypothetical protein
MAQSSSRLATVMVVMLVLIASSSFAFVEPQSTEIREKAFRHPDLYLGQVYLPATQAVANGFSQVPLDLATLGVTPESAFLDVRTGRFGTLLPSSPMLPGRGQDNALTWNENWGLEAPENLAHHKRLAWEAFAGYLVANQGSLKIDLAELQNPGTVTILNDGGLVQINAKRFVDGIAVRNSFVTAVINHGNLVLFGARNWADIEVSATPTLNLEAARSKVSQHLGTLANSARWGRTSLLYVPVSGDHGAHRLVWAVDARFDSDKLAQWEALVDAHTGELVAFEDTTKYASVRQLVGGQFPLSNDGVAPDGVEVTSPMPFADVEIGGVNYVTDTGGNVLVCLDGDMTTTLQGPYLTMNDTCGATTETDAGPVHDLGSSGGTDCTTPATADSAGNTHASRSGFYEINRMIELAQAQLVDNTWLRNPVPSQMNVDDNCNASGGAGGFNFFTSGGGCANTGELAGVFVHEWGHGMDASDANPGFQNPPEGIADIFASLRLNTSCMGRNFALGVNCSGFGDPCLACDGVRDIDWANRASGVPHDLAWIDANCGSGPAPCGGIVHCEGAAPAESVWDLWNRDLVGAPYNMSVDTARELAVQLTFQGTGPVGEWYNCAAGTGVGDGCNADGGYLNFLAADDDDGNLANGTPHMAAIFAAYDRHGIACATPTVQDGGCASTPTTAPNVVATPFDRAVVVTWDAVANASGYRIYRTEGVQACDFGKTLVGETNTALFFNDSGLGNGREYYYIVIPMGPGESCIGPASSCTAVTPSSGANLAIDSGSAMLTVNTGDGDAYIDNCEQATVTFDIPNVGTGMVNGVAVQSVKSTSHPGMNQSISINAASPTALAECSIATGSFDFEGIDLAFDDDIEFEVCVTSTELAPAVRCGVITIQNAESNDQFFATRSFSLEADNEGWTVVRGTFDRTSGSAADGTFAFRSSTLLDNQCDEVRSPGLKLAATSTLSLETNYDIEDFSADTWYDRANVAIVEANGTRNLVTPDSGRMYNADSSGPGNYSGCNNPEEGWAGLDDTWAASSWTAGALGSAGVAGEPVQLSVIYSTDGGLAMRGFWVDAITLTDIELQVPDDQEDCASGFIFGDGFESGELSAWSRVVQ